MAHRKDSGLHNGWNNVPPRRQMRSRDLGYQGSEIPLKSAGHRYVRLRLPNTRSWR
jgi:hypothetical protein